MGVGVQRHAPAALPPGKTQHPLYRRLVGPQAGSRRVRKTSPPIFRVTYKNIRNPNSPSKRISEPLDGTKNVLNFLCSLNQIKFVYLETQKLYVLS